MGYYTDFNIQIRSTKTHNVEQIVQKLENICGYKTYQYDGIISLQEVKWYDHEKDMIELSNCFPDILFVTDGQGEEHDDIWKSYAYNGRYERVDAKLIYPDSNIEKMYEFDISVEEVLNEPSEKDG